MKVSKILLINHYAGSPKYGMEYRPYYLAKHWVDMGIEVEILSSSFSHARLQNPNLHEVGNVEIIDGIVYRWIPCREYSHNDINRVTNMAQFVTKATRMSSQLAKNKPDIVIASSTYPLDIFPAKKIASQANAKLIYEVHDIWPEGIIELGGYSRWHPYILAMAYAEKYAYRHCDAIVSILPLFDKYLKEHNHSCRKLIHVPNGFEEIPESAALGAELPETVKKALISAKEQGKFIIGYTGAHGPANELNRMLDAAKHLESANVQILLVGDGTEREKLQKRVDESGLQNIKLLGKISKNSVSKFLEQCDALYIGLKKVDIFRYGISPNKLIEYMCVGKPIISSVNAGNDLVGMAACGISIKSGDPRELADEIVNLASLPNDVLRRMGASGKRYVHEHHAYHTLARNFIDEAERI